MPVLRGDPPSLPSWCELETYRILTLPTDAESMWTARHPANKLVVVHGAGTVRTGDRRHPVRRGDVVDLPAGTNVVHAEESMTVVTLGGHWGEDCGGSGLFGVVTAEEPKDVGDTVDYPKSTAFDRHYHDCDEYWIIVSGAGTASSENMLYEVGPGDCVATRMGHHHDFPLVDKPVSAVFFETTMRGQKRRGHLWEHTHGPAVPCEEGE